MICVARSTSYNTETIKPEPFPLDYKYSRFVAFATLIAHETLRRVLRGSDEIPSPNVLRDAAQIGAKRAKERIFPGLPRDPFTINPVDDIVLGLRYYYEPQTEVPAATPGEDSRFDSEKYLADSRGTPPRAADLMASRETNYGTKADTKFPFAPKVRRYPRAD